MAGLNQLLIIWLDISSSTTTNWQAIRGRR
jgi:hypothetical protein